MMKLTAIGRTKRLVMIALSLPLVILPVACGGGSGGVTTPNPIAPSTPVEATGDLVVDTTQYVSYPNSIKSTAADSKKIAAVFTSASDGKNGDVEVSACFRFSSVAPAERRQGILFARSNRNDSENATAYQARIVGGGGLQLYKSIGGETQQIGAAVGARAFGANVWYQLAFNCSGGTLSVKCRRLTDGKFLQTNGTWAFGEVAALSLDDTSIAGQGFAGYGAYQIQSGAVWVDEFRVARASDRLSLVVTDGNSLTDGRITTYAAQLVAKLGPSWTLLNFGVNGQITSQMAADAARQIDPLSMPSNRPALVAWEITNDLRQGAGRDAAYERYKSYCRARRAAGFSVVAVTILPRSQTFLPPTFEADRMAINAMMRQEWPSFADALADVAGDNRIGDLGDELDRTLYRDGIHPTPEGDAIVASIVAPAVLRAQNQPRALRRIAVKRQ